MAMQLTVSALMARLPKQSWLRLRPQSPRQIGPLVVAALLGALLILQLVRLMWALLVPLSPVGTWQPQTAVIASPAERRALFAGFDPYFRSHVQSSGVASVTSLGLTLFGVNINEATGGGSAIIAGEDDVQSSYAVGDEIAPGVRLAAVAFDHVLIEHGGARESLYLDQSGAAPLAIPGAAPSLALAPDVGSASAATASGALSPAALKSGIGFSPRTEGGRVTGLVVQPQGDGSSFRAAGLKPGDVIRSVNGRSIGSPSDAEVLANQLTPGARISLEVERGARVVPVALFLSKS